MCMAFGTRLIYVEYSKSGEEIIEMTLGEKIHNPQIRPMQFSLHFPDAMQAGLSQEQLSEKLGVSRSAVAKWGTDVGWELVTYDYMATSMQIKGTFVITFRKEKV